MGYYNEIAEGYNNLYKEEQLKKIDIILSNIKINQEDKLLDVGCGTGVSSKRFKCRVYGIDPSEKLLEKAGNGFFIKAYAENIPFEDTFFDIVIAVTSMHNFYDINRGIDEMKRVGNNLFVFSVLKKSEKFELIKKKIYASFDVKNVIDEGKDLIFFCSLLS